MIFRPYYRFDTGCAGYLFGCLGSGRVAVVDPHRGDVEAYSAFVSGKASSTLSFEKRWNPLLSSRRDDFITAVSSPFPRLRGMQEILRIKQGRGEAAP